MYLAYLLTGIHRLPKWIGVRTASPTGVPRDFTNEGSRATVLLSSTVLGLTPSDLLLSERTPSAALDTFQGDFQPLFHLFGASARTPHRRRQPQTKMSQTFEKVRIKSKQAGDEGRSVQTYTS